MNEKKTNRKGIAVALILTVSMIIMGLAGFYVSKQRGNVEHTTISSYKAYNKQDKAAQIGIDRGYTQKDIQKIRVLLDKMDKIPYEPVCMYHGHEVMKRF